jgi:hypothetical protein
MRFGKQKESSRQRPTGTNQPSPVYSYYNAPAPKNTHEKTIDLSSTPSKLRLLPTILAATAIIISLLFNLTLSAKPYLAIADDNKYIYRPEEAYMQEAEKILGSSISNMTKLTINLAQAEEQMLSKFPELYAVSLRLPVLGRRLNMVLDIRTPAVILSTPGKSLIIDSTGRAVSRLQDLQIESRKDLIVIKDESGLQVNIGEQAVTTETVDFIKSVSAQLSGQSLVVSELTLPQAANQLDIRLEGIPYFIKTDIAGDARLQIGSFLAVKEKLGREGVVPAEYVDVRVEEKVFYK